MSIGHHALVKVRGGSLLLDLERGGLFQLNDSATFVWERWLAKVPATEIAQTLAASHFLPLETAHAHVAEALARHRVSPREPPEFAYERSVNRYIFSRGGEPILTVSDRGESVELAEGSEIERNDLRNVLLAIAPKLLALRGHCVLHASAVVLDSGISAFCGESGAGKTTTARSLARAGATLVCEDKLVIRRTGDRVEVLSGIEEDLYRWSDVAAASLAKGSPTACPDLAPTNPAWPIPLREIGFIDVTRRRAETIVATPLTQLAGAGQIFRNSFYGSDVDDEWRQHLQRAVDLAALVGTYDLTMPAGTTALASATEVLLRRGALRSL